MKVIMKKEEDIDILNSQSVVLKWTITKSLLSTLHDETFEQKNSVVEKRDMFWHQFCGYCFNRGAFEKTSYQSR